MDEVKFIDLFAGIGGTRLGVELAAKKLGLASKCVFTSEWDRFAQKTYFENFGEMPRGDIRQITSDEIPSHDILLAGFPCQPFSIAGVSKKNALGKAHGFECKTQGTLFFEIQRILDSKRPPCFILENVKNLQYHNGGATYKVIKQVLEDLEYQVFPRVYSSEPLVPQRRERVFIVGFKSDLDSSGFELADVSGNHPKLVSILQRRVDPKYTLTDHLWEYLQGYKKKHQKQGNGFGYNLYGPGDTAGTLSARYYKDGSEILIRQKGRNPRRLTPRECARLMGFPEDLKIPVSDTQFYRQAGNSVVVPLVASIAEQVISQFLGIDEILNREIAVGT